MMSRELCRAANCLSLLSKKLSASEAYRQKCKASLWHFSSPLQIGKATHRGQLDQLNKASCLGKPPTWRLCVPFARLWSCTCSTAYSSLYLGPCRPLSKFPTLWLLKTGNECLSAKIRAYTVLLVSVKKWYPWYLKLECAFFTLARPLSKWPVFRNMCWWHNTKALLSARGFFFI